MIRTGKVIVELKNGQRFTYVNWPADAIVDDLKRMDVKAIGLKNTWHIIPRQCRCTMPDLTDAERAELRYISERHGASGPSTPPYDGYARDRKLAFRLKRKGYVRVEIYSEHVRGEPRFYWKVFRLTDQGKAAIA